MRKLAKLYDFALGVAIGVGTMLLIQGDSDAALAAAVAALCLRLTIGRDQKGAA